MKRKQAMWWQNVSYYTEYTMQNFNIYSTVAGLIYIKKIYDYIVNKLQTSRKAVLKKHCIGKKKTRKETQQENLKWYSQKTSTTLLIREKQIIPQWAIKRMGHMTKDRIFNTGQNQQSYFTLLVSV